MHGNDRKRREPVVHRGQRVPNLYKRPRRGGGRQEGDTFEVVFRDDLGKQRQKTLKARTLQRAITEAEDYRTQVRRGEVVASSRLTLSEVAAEFFTIMEALVSTGERSQRTLDLYRQRFGKHIELALGRRRVQDIRPDQIGAVFARQRKDGLAPWTMSGTLTILSALFRFAVSRGYVAANPVARLDKVERPKQVSEREARRLPEKDVRALCAAVIDTYRPIVTTLAWTGLRISEALALRWQDIDFDNREIHLLFQLDDKGVLKKPKTKAGVRRVPLLPVVEQELRALRQEKFALGMAAAEQFIFTTAAGKPLDRNNVRRRGVVAAAEKAGLHTEGTSTVTTHDLRRTFLSHLIITLGLDPVRVSKIAGHSNVSVTLNVYADEFDKAQHHDDLMARIEQAGFGAI